MKTIKKVKSYRLTCIIWLIMTMFLPLKAEKLTMNLLDVSLSDALLKIECNQESFHLYFDYNELKKYHVTIRIRELAPKDAVRAVCKDFPVSVAIKGKNIFVLEKVEKVSVSYPKGTVRLEDVKMNTWPHIRVEKAGSLSSLLTQEQQDTITMLTLSGKLNSADIRTLRHMTGFKEEGYSTGRLEWLDIREAKIVTDKEPYLVIEEAENLIRLRTRVTEYRSNKLFEASYSKWSLENDFQNISRHYDTTNPRPNFPSTKFSYILLGGKGESPQWDDVKKRKLTHFKGHVLEQKDGHIRYSAFTCKNSFCYDMFLGCPTLVFLHFSQFKNDKVYVIPDRTVFSKTVLK